MTTVCRHCEGTGIDKMNYKIKCLACGGYPIPTPGMSIQAVKRRYPDLPLNYHYDGVPRCCVCRGTAIDITIDSLGVMAWCVECGVDIARVRELSHAIPLSGRVRSYSYLVKGMLEDEHTT